MSFDTGHEEEPGSRYPGEPELPPVEEAEEFDPEAEQGSRRRLWPIIGAAVGVLMLLGLVAMIVIQKMGAKPARPAPAVEMRPAPAAPAAAYPDPAGLASPRPDAAPLAQPVAPAAVQPQAAAAPSIMLDQGQTAKAGALDAPANPKMDAAPVAQAVTPAAKPKEIDQEAAALVAKLSDRLAAVEARLQKLESTPAARNASVKDEAPRQRSQPAARVDRASAVKGGEVLSKDARVQAVVPGQAWIEIHGERKVLHVGDEVLGAKVLSIDADKGVVLTSKGRIE